MARVLRFAIATSLVGLVALGVVAWRAFPLTSPAEAQPAPLGQSDGGALLGRDARSCDGLTDATHYGPSLEVPGAEGACVALTGPTPVIAETPLPILLPLTATAALGGAVLLARRRGKAQREARGKEAADGE
jgi:hypothetical protein